MADPFRLAFDVWAEARVPLARHLPAADIEATDELLADRSGAATPRVMIFGVYNAGKSTLINALLGKEVARVADHPETDRITSYPWRGFLLDDTPGIDAPIDHEKVTRAHLESSDAVLFMLATDGTLEEKQTFNEIIQLVRIGKPIRIILNNKSSFRLDSSEFLDLCDRLAENLRSAAASASVDDIEARAPIRLVNAASGLRGRLEGKSVLLANSGLLELEADIFDLCKATGKAQMALTFCRRLAKQIDLALTCLPIDGSSLQFREVGDAVSAERIRLTTVLDQATKEASTQFEAALRQAVLNQRPELAQLAANESADTVTEIIERELRKTQRIFGEIERSFDGHAVTINLMTGKSIPLPEGIASQDTPSGNGFSFSDAVSLLAPGLNQLGKKGIVDGFLAAKQLFPDAFKGLGPVFFGRIASLVGPGIQAVTGIYDAYSEHREAQREFEREKDRRMVLEQQIVDAGRKMHWALTQQCHDIIETVFGPVEESLAMQTSTLKGQALMVESDRVVLLKCKGRLAIEME